jgi:hypothetical protein
VVVWLRNQATVSARAWPVGVGSAAKWVRNLESSTIHGSVKLVEGVEVLTHRRLGDADGAQRECSGRHQPGLGAGEGVHGVDEVSGGGSAVDGQVPHLPGGTRLRAEGREGCGDVGGVGVAVRLVGPAHHLRGASAQCRLEHGLAEGGAPCAGTEVVGCTTDGDLDVARVVGGEQLLGHRGARGGLLRGRVRGRGLDQWLPVRRSVGVQVVQHDEAGSGCPGAGEDAALQGRELVGPAFVVERIEAEVDGVRAGADLGGERGVGRVTSDGAGSAGAGVAVAVDRDDVVACGGEVGDEGMADLTGPEDDVT